MQIQNRSIITKIKIKELVNMFRAKKSLPFKRHLNQGKQNVSKEIIAMGQFQFNIDQSKGMK